MKTRREIREQLAVDPYAGDGALVVKDLGGGYTQTQAGPRAPRLSPEEIARLLHFADDRPPEDRIHRVELTTEELAELEDPDPELES